MTRDARPYAVIVESADPVAIREALERSAAEVIKLPHIGAFAVMSDDDPRCYLGPGVRTFPTRRGHVQVAIGIDRILDAGKAVAADERPNGLYVDDGRPSLTPCAHPRLTRTETGLPRIEGEREVLLTQTGRLVAINLSVGSGRKYRYTDDDFVNHATQRASGYVPVVVAAGNNYRDAGGRETMSAWAEPDWVISVGATDRSDGGHVADYSAVGSRDDDDSGPTVVAYGQSRLSSSPRWRGTSFAAPRVATACAFAAGFLLNVIHVLQAYAASESIKGIPLLAIGAVDRGFSGPLESRPRQLPSLPIAGVDADQVAEAVDVLAEAGRTLTLKSLAAAIRSLVIGSARPLANHARYEMGAGFVSDQGVRAHLESLTGLDMARMLSEGPDLPAQSEDLLKRIRLADRTLLADAMDVWSSSARRWLVHRYSGREIDLTWSLDSPAAAELPRSS